MSAQRERGRGLIFFLVVVVIIFVSVGNLSKCVSSGSQAAGELAGQAVTGLISGLWRGLTGTISKKWDEATDWGGEKAKEPLDIWDNMSASEKMGIVCENLPIAGMDKVCPYFVEPLKGAEDAQVERIACWWQAASELPNPQPTVMHIANTCVSQKNDARALESCLQRQVMGYDPSMGNRCSGYAPGQFFNAARSMIKPLACPKGMPGTACDVEEKRKQENEKRAEQADPNAPRTDPYYLNCLTAYRDQNRLRQTDGCGAPDAAVTPQNAGCVRGAILSKSGYGLAQVAYCDAMPRPAY